MQSTLNPEQTNGGGQSISFPIIPKPLVGKDLHDAILSRVNYYMSHENLKKDVFLVQHMTPEMWVDIAVIAKFKGIAMLSASVEDVAEAMRKSDSVLVSADGLQIKPNIKVERKTLILRDIPSDADPEDVKAVFSHLEGNSAPTDFHSEVGDNWFVTFESEERCLEAHLSLASKSFNDQPIRSRIKSETVMRSFYQPKSVPAFSFPSTQATGEEDLYFDAATGQVYSRDPATGQYYLQPSRPFRPRTDRRGAPPGGDPRGLAKKQKKKRIQPPQPLQLGATHFPPLPTKQDLRDAGKADNSGYGDVNYRRIDFEQAYKVIAIVKGSSALSSRPAFLTDSPALLESCHIPHAAHTFSSEESAEVFVQVDQTPDKRGMSPFVSPMFVSVNTADFPPDFLLPPSAFAQPLPPKSASLAPVRTAKQVLTSGIRQAPPRAGPPLTSTPSPSPSPSPSSPPAPVPNPPATTTSSATNVNAPSVSTGAAAPVPLANKGGKAAKPSDKSQESRDTVPKTEEKKEVNSFKDVLLASPSKPAVEKRQTQE